MSTGIVDGQTVEESSFRGLIFPYAGSSAPTGFLLCDGSAVSRTTYAELFALIGITYGAGDGSTTFNVPDLRGSVIIGAGTRVRAMAFDGASGVDPTTDQITVTSNQWLITGQAVVLSGSALPTGLTAGTYYVIRVSATVIKLASSLADAQNGTAVNITADGIGSCTLTQTLTSRTLGSDGGEETHAMSVSELLSHSHTLTERQGSGDSPPAPSMGNGGSGTSAFTGLSVDSTGGNAAMNIMNPFTVVNFIIKT